MKWFLEAKSNFSALLTELNTNYTSVVTMITFFLPHLIALGVGASTNCRLFRFAYANAAGGGAAYLFVHHLFWPGNDDSALALQLLCNEGRRA